MRILIVDDKAENRYLLRTLLTSTGHEVVEANDGNEALISAREIPPDLVISDILMPVMDGFSLCRAWKNDADLKSVPFVFYTAAYTDPKDRAFALSLGADRFFVKPLEPHVFLEKIQDVLSTKIKARQVATASEGKEETTYFKQYNERLIAQLEHKLEQLELTNVQLTKEIEERKRAEKMIRYLAYNDRLTDLPNRISFHDRLQNEMRTVRKERGGIGVLLMDLDRFREVNDTLGHKNGDCVLVEVSKRLKRMFSNVQWIARLGGDEFAVLVPNVVSVSDMHSLASSIRTALETPFEVEGLHIDIGASIGIATYPHNGQDAVTLMRRAEVAMYRAKRTKNGIVSYDPAFDHYSPRRLALMGELRKGIKQDQLLLHYQPKVNLSSASIVSVEALVRWRHPTLGELMPDDFVPMAEHTGLISPMTEWVLSAAVAQCLKWKKLGLNISVAVNLSVRNLLDAHLPKKVGRLLELHHVPPGLLTLEVTESAIMGDPDKALSSIKQLKEMGVHLSIDDFGTGYSSLSYLKALPVTELKIDQSFVKGMGSDRSDAIIVQSTIDLGHNLGLKVTAEGVENRQSWQYLRTFGCDVAQGYYMSRPLTAQQLMSWVRESEWGLQPMH